MLKLNLVERVGIVNLMEKSEIIFDINANSNLPEGGHYQPTKSYQKPILKKQTTINFPYKIQKYSVKGKR